MKYKFIPVDNNIDKAIAFANTLDSSNIKNVQKIKQKPFYIDTLDVIKQLQGEGWELKGVAEARLSNRKVGFNYAQLQHPDFNITNSNGKIEALASITIQNSCSGAKPLDMSLGAFRLVCSNGLVRMDNAEHTKIKHTEINYNKLPQLITELNNKSIILADEIDRMRNTNMSIDDIKKFAYNAAKLRFGNEVKEDHVNELLRVNRIEDEGTDAWKVFNRIQENLTMNVRDMRQDFKLNKELFSMVDKLVLN